MKLIVQIPCYNEEKTIAETINDIPRELQGVDKVEVLIIDDGSSDSTVKAAEEAGVDHIVKNICNKGLAHTFITGLDACLRLRADIITFLNYRTRSAGCGPGQYPDDAADPGGDGNQGALCRDSGQRHSAGWPYGLGPLAGHGHPHRGPQPPRLLRQGQGRQRRPWRSRGHRL